MGVCVCEKEQMMMMLVKVEGTAVCDIFMAVIIKSIDRTLAQPGFHY